jgi:hypothetical protein
MEATVHARGVRIGFVQSLGLLASAGRDRPQRSRPDATSRLAPFKGAVGMQPPAVASAHLDAR